MGNGTNVKMKHDIDSLHRIYHHGHRRRFLLFFASPQKKKPTANVRIYNIVMDSVCEWMQTDWIDHSIRFTSECAHRAHTGHSQTCNTIRTGVWVACVCLSTIYANDTTISYQPDIIFRSLFIKWRLPANTHTHSRNEIRFLFASSDWSWQSTTVQMNELSALLLFLSGQPTTTIVEWNRRFGRGNRTFDSPQNIPSSIYVWNTQFDVSSTTT